MSNPFQSITLEDAPAGHVQETGSLVPITGTSIAIALFSNDAIAHNVTGWTGTPSGWAGINGSFQNGFNNVTGSPTVQAGPMTDTLSGNTEWGSVLLLFAASANLTVLNDLAVVSGGFGGGPINYVPPVDIPAGATLIAVLQGTGGAFTPQWTGISDTAGLAWSPIITAAATSGLNWTAVAAASVVINTPHIAANTDTVTFQVPVGGGGSVLRILVITGPIPLTFGGSFGSMLL